MEWLLVLMALSPLEAFLLQRTILVDFTFYTITLGLLGVHSLLGILWNVWIYPYCVTPLRHLPTLSGNLGMVQIIFDNPRGRVPLEWMKTVPHDGLIHFRDVFSRSYLLATNHQALLDILSTNTDDFEKPWRIRDFLARIIGFGLILSEGSAHKKQRRALTPSFSAKNVRALYSLMWEKTGLLMEELEKEIKRHPMDGANGKSEEGKVEMSVWASRLTLDIIGPAAMGRDFRSLHTSANKVADIFLAILEPTKEKMVFLVFNFLLPQWLARRIPWRLNKALDDEIRFLRELCRDIVHEKRASITATKETIKELEADILATMMLGGDFTDDELIDQMLTFLAAGHETTANAFTWACYLLARYPDVQARLRAEVRERIPSGNGSITWSGLETLPLLNGVCQEVLRLYPTVPITAREAIRDSIVAGKHIPKGTRILLCPYAINRSPEFWGNDSEEFKPERWIDTAKNGQPVVNNNGGASTNFALITFLHGHRSCIGKDFARAELRCAIAGLVGRFRFEMQDPKQKIHIAGAVTNKPVEGMHLRMSRVDDW
ncbi:cytochrome P450 [Aspergillus coremiiformis]|uniref:Cytochrome P450 n=1 Tax=Aspergillus coremiiformis TaxID=138285 RepID=A0A5N6ZDY0_9EURO|nr:cytochrome P450 [Aspergillus coremiiformis]